MGAVSTGNLPGSYRHGTYTGYAHYGCRCDKCRLYQIERVRRNRADRLAAGVNHGTRSGYDAGCRCGVCFSARLAAYRKECLALLAGKS